MEQLITVATFNERDPADHIATRLREAGLNAEVYDESHEQKWKLFNLHPRAHMRVRVHSTEESHAHALLDEWQGGDPALGQAIKCPECGSSRIEFPQFSRRTIMGALPAPSSRDRGDCAGVLLRSLSLHLARRDEGRTRPRRLAHGAGAPRCRK
ncbi:MAG: hypothetical protein WDN28_13905 [Chthoniobacter sp.]